MVYNNTGLWDRGNTSSLLCKTGSVFLCSQIELGPSIVRIAGRPCTAAGIWVGFPWGRCAVYETGEWSIGGKHPRVIGSQQDLSLGDEVIEGARK